MHGGNFSQFKMVNTESKRKMLVEISNSRAAGVAISSGRTGAVLWAGLTERRASEWQWQPRAGTRRARLDGRYFV
jgi:hypothetical protein